MLGQIVAIAITLFGTWFAAWLYGDFPATNMSFLVGLLTALMAVFVQDVINGNVRGRE